MTVQGSSSAHKSLPSSGAIDEFQHLWELQTWISVALEHFLLTEQVTLTVMHVLITILFSLDLLYQAKEGMVNQAELTFLAHDVT